MRELRKEGHLKQNNIVKIARFLFIISVKTNSNYFKVNFVGFSKLKESCLVMKRCVVLGDLTNPFIF